MPQAKDEGDMAPLSATFASLFQNANYRNGVWSQVLYVGAQIMCWTYIYQYAEAIGISSEKAANYQFVCFIVFLLGRAIGTYLLRFVNSGKLLYQFAVMAGICVLGTVFIEGIIGLYALVGISFFMSLMFPTIYGIALEDLDEKESKIGAAGLVMAIVGGALMPKLQGMIIDLGGSGVRDTQILGVSEVNFSFLLPLLCFIFIAYFGKTVSKNA
jgi:FHS family L-fucose permease-like MFS transporter